MDIGVRRFYQPALVQRPIYRHGSTACGRRGNALCAISQHLDAGHDRLQTMAYHRTHTGHVHAKRNGFQTCPEILAHHLRRNCTCGLATSFVN